MEEIDDIKTGQDLIDENRGKYIVQGTDVIGAQPPFMVPTRFPFNPSPPVQYAAEVVKQVVQKSFHDATVV